MTTSSVLVCSADPALSELLKQNLARRRFDVRLANWAPCHEDPSEVAEVTNVVVVDLDCPAPDCWQAIGRLREAFASLPVVLLAHDRPGAEPLRAWWPYRYVRKPFGMDELVRAVRELALEGAGAFVRRD